MGRQLNLNLFIYGGGHHEAAWRHPKSQPEKVLDSVSPPRAHAQSFIAGLLSGSNGLQPRSLAGLLEAAHSVKPPGGAG